MGEIGEIKVWKGSLSIRDTVISYINLVWVKKGRAMLSGHEVRPSGVRLWRVYGDCCLCRSSCVQGSCCLWGLESNADGEHRATVVR